MKFLVGKLLFIYGFTVLHTTNIWTDAFLEFLGTSLLE